jgi:replicative DNA helicase
MVKRMAAAGKQSVVSDGAAVGRERPHSVDFEQALLACCMIEGGQEIVPLCVEGKISANSFYLPSHRLIWEAIVAITNDGKPLDVMFVVEHLRINGKLSSIGDVQYVNQICDRVDTTAHINHYIRRIRDLELVRCVVAASIANIERAYAEASDANDVVEKAESEIFEISANRVSDGAVHIRKPLDMAVNSIQLMQQNRGEMTGVPSGFIDLDRLTFGFKNSEMIVIAARPSVGKTSLAMNIAENVILPGKKRSPMGVLFFSLEMTADQLALRLLCGRAGINMTKLQDGFISKSASDSLYTTAKELQTAPLWIDESTNMTIFEIRAKARRMCSKEKIGLLIVDYLQLISGDNRIPREQQIAEISRGVKLMAKELRIPVVVLSQVNRSSEKERRQPKLSDLRESGAIEQDADLVMILAKQSNEGEEEEGEEHFAQDAVVRDLVVAKNRNGPIGVVPLTFIRSLTRFENYVDERKFE